MTRKGRQLKYLEILLLDVFCGMGDVVLVDDYTNSDSDLKNSSQWEK